MAKRKTRSDPVAPDDPIGLVTTVTIVVLAGGIVLPLLSGAVHPTHGARASIRLQQEERSAVIQQALMQFKQEQSHEPGAVPPPIEGSVQEDEVR